MLPVDHNGTPYWEVMESFMRDSESEEIHTYLEYLEKNKAIN